MSVMLMMDKLCYELNNWFVADVTDIHTGTFEITASGLMPPNFLLDSQYYRIIGSKIGNDGVHRVGELHENEFVPEIIENGAVWAMSVPRAVIELADKISDWLDKYEAFALSPFTSENYFNDWSYSKSVNGKGAAAASWKKQFDDELKVWRKL